MLKKNQRQVMKAAMQFDDMAEEGLMHPMDMVEEEDGDWTRCEMRCQSFVVGY